MDISIFIKLHYCLFVCLFKKGLYLKDGDKTLTYNLDRD